MDKIPVTKDGFVAMEKELKRLKSEERPSIVKAIAEAREHGDLKENAEYHAARERQSFCEGRIQELEARVAHAEVIDPSELSGDTIKFGATVELVDEDSEEEITYQIVGEYEADIKQNRLSITAPISRALVGKSEGDSIEVQTPGGTRHYEILKVKYA